MKEVHSFIEGVHGFMKEVHSFIEGVHRNFECVHRFFERVHREKMPLAERSAMPEASRFFVGWRVGPSEEYVDLIGLSRQAAGQFQTFPGLSGPGMIGPFLFA